MAKESKTTIYLVRHGETEWNVKRITQGHKDSELTKKGMEQAKELARQLVAVEFDLIFSSDLGRAKTTAEIIASERGVEIITHPALRERSWGIFEGRARDEWGKEYKDMLEAWNKLSAEEQRRYRLHESVETEEEMAFRFMDYVRQQAIIRAGKTFLVVSHGGPIRNFLVHAGFATHEELLVGSFKNAGYVKTTYNGERFVIEEVIGVEKAKI